MNETLKKRIEEAVRKYAQLFEQVGYDDDQIDTIKNAILYGSDLALQNQWIPVSEGLPKEGKCVLGLTNMEQMDGNILVVKLRDGIWWWQDGFVCGKDNLTGEKIYSSECSIGSVYTKNVTHWMEIPSLKGDEG